MCNNTSNLNEGKRKFYFKKMLINHLFEKNNYNFIIFPNCYSFFWLILSSKSNKTYLNFFLSLLFYF